MTYEERQKLEEELKSLPSGGISYKTINQTRYAYYQWQENGKQRCRRVKETEFSELSAALKRRKEIKSLLKGESADNRVSDNLLSGASKVTANFLFGKDLLKFTAASSEIKERNQVSAISDYMDGSDAKLFILSGLRLSGKTSIIRSSILSMSKTRQKKCAYAKVGNEMLLKEIVGEIRSLREFGIEYFFIDDITNAEDFYNSVSLLSDLCELGTKIVAAAGSTLAINIAKSKQLYSKCIICRCDPILYDEYRKFANANRQGIKNYLECGAFAGCIGEEDFLLKNDNLLLYLDNAAADNIISSLCKTKTLQAFGVLKEEYESGNLGKLICSVIMNYCDDYALRVFKAAFKIEKLTSVKQIIKDYERSEIADNCAEKAFEFLVSCGFIDAIKVDRIARQKERRIKYSFIYPPILFSECKGLIGKMAETLFADETPERKQLINTIVDNKIFESILKDYILCEMCKRNSDTEIFRSEIEIPDVQNHSVRMVYTDMIERNPYDRSCILYDISTAVKPDARFSASLSDESSIGIIEKYYGKVKAKKVFYLGDDYTDYSNGSLGAIEYINIEKYLCAK